MLVFVLLVFELLGLYYYFKQYLIICIDFLYIVCVVDFDKKIVAKFVLVPIKKDL
jgi:hypothetical protein